MLNYLPTAPVTADNRQDQLVWKMLFDRQTALLHRRAAPAFSEGLARLGLRREAIPDIGELSRTVRALSEPANQGRSQGASQSVSRRISKTRSPKPTRAGPPS